ncbi:endonuclease/exonuclease/phosphatase family protein [Defluviimonas sp. SAOS-178_SWC]|uniref:endonuclease/exonuclease/phosphatase family protein n=1 Tax=Defluviimonas sp. SAOS-178_SWC TaxID=3121287 RepID=UPI00322188EF
MRVATYNADLSRKGPGLLLRDILTGTDPQVEAAASVIAAAAPDVLLLTGIDYDLDLVALNAFAGRIAIKGRDYPHRFALRPNTGWATGIDVDGDGRTGGPGDAQGFGRFAGEGGMAILSRLPLGPAEDYSGFLWRDLPGALIDGAELSPEASTVQRLSSTGHWAVPVDLPGGGTLTLLAWHASPPVFDGPEDRNGRRNHDEAAFWSRLLDGALPYPPPKGPLVLLGDANLDTVDGDGQPDALKALLNGDRFRDPKPASTGGVAAAGQGGANVGQSGDPALDTADWPDDPGPGNMRVDYVLPSSALKVTAAGVWWPEPGSDAAVLAEAASRHRLVWVDLDLP